MLEQGQIVRVRMARTSDEWCLAEVAAASGTSVVLWLATGVRAPGGWIARCLPLVIDYEKELVTGLLGGEYEIEVSDSGVVS